MAIAESHHPRTASAAGDVCTVRGLLLLLLLLLLLNLFVIETPVVHAVLFDGQLPQQPLHSRLVALQQALSYRVSVHPLDLLAHAVRRAKGRVSAYHMPLTTNITHDTHETNKAHMTHT